MDKLGDFIINFCTKFYQLTRSVNFWKTLSGSQHFFPHLSMASLTPLLKSPLIKNTPFLINSSFHLVLFLPSFLYKYLCPCFYKSVFNWIFFSSSVESQSHQTLCQSTQVRQKKNPILLNMKITLRSSLLKLPNYWRNICIFLSKMEKAKGLSQGQKTKSTIKSLSQ